MSPLRLSMVGLLLAAGAYGLYLNARAESPEPTAAPTGAETAEGEVALDIDEEAEERSLRQRFDLFRKLRLQDDVVALYDLADPEQRTKVDLRSFLSFYGHGMVRFNEVRLDSIEFDWPKREATVTATTSAELLVEKLPSSYKLAAQTKETDAKIEAPHTIGWVQREDGQWYFRMDQQIVSGQTADGRGVQPF